MHNHKIDGKQEEHDAAGKQLVEMQHQGADERPQADDDERTTKCKPYGNLARGEGAAHQYLLPNRIAFGEGHIDINKLLLLFGRCAHRLGLAARACGSLQYTNLYIIADNGHYGARMLYLVLHFAKYRLQSTCKFIIYFAHNIYL